MQPALQVAPEIQEVQVAQAVLEVQVAQALQVPQAELAQPVQLAQLVIPEAQVKKVQRAVTRSSSCRLPPHHVNSLKIFWRCDLFASPKFAFLCSLIQPVDDAYVLLVGADSVEHWAVRLPV